MQRFYTDADPAVNPDAIPATVQPWPGRVRWYILDGPRSQTTFRPTTMQAMGEGAEIVFHGVPYAFNPDLRSILAVYRRCWRVRITPANARRIAAWLAWWAIPTDRDALELLRTCAAGSAVTA